MQDGLPVSEDLWRVCSWHHDARTWFPEFVQLYLTKNSLRCYLNNWQGPLPMGFSLVGSSLPSTLTLSIVPCCVLGAIHRHGNTVVGCFQIPMTQWLTGGPEGHILNKKETLSLYTSHAIPRALWASHNYTEACVGDTANQFSAREGEKNSQPHTSSCTPLASTRITLEYGLGMCSTKNCKPSRWPQVMLCARPWGHEEEGEDMPQRIALTSPYFWISIHISFLEIIYWANEMYKRKEKIIYLEIILKIIRKILVFKKFICSNLQLTYLLYFWLKHFLWVSVCSHLFYNNLFLPTFESLLFTNLWLLTNNYPIFSICN